MYTLTIDIGNSSTKAEFWKDGDCKNRITYDNFLSENFLPLIKNFGAEAVVISSVNSSASEQIKEFQHTATCKVILFTDEEIRKFYDHSHYKTPIGPDRFAAYLGAESLYPEKSKMIVDIGTAMTIDVADDKGIYRGGNISLGLYSRIKALEKSTSLLPLVEDITTQAKFGNDTRSAIALGAKYGVIGEILLSQKLLKQVFGGDLTILTGGDAPLVYESLKTDHNVIKDLHLVGRGLNYHYLTHYND
ncbi:MAG: type III pantothenate kinase [Muribaculaceae bacterium]|nr:type III pantothenate kinase [Muribaculaceae bacterium]